MRWGFTSLMNKCIVIDSRLKFHALKYLIRDLNYRQKRECTSCSYWLFKRELSVHWVFKQYFISHILGKTNDIVLFSRITFQNYHGENTIMTPWFKKRYVVSWYYEWFQPWKFPSGNFRPIVHITYLWTYKTPW